MCVSPAPSHPVQILLVGPSILSNGLTQHRAPGRHCQLLKLPPELLDSQFIASFDPHNSPFLEIVFLFYDEEAKAQNYHVPSPQALSSKWQTRIQTQSVRIQSPNSPSLLKPEVSRGTISIAVTSGSSTVLLQGLIASIPIPLVNPTPGPEKPGPFKSCSSQ